MVWTSGNHAVKDRQKLMKKQHKVAKAVEGRPTHTPAPWEVTTTVTDYNATGQEIGTGIKIQYGGPDHRWHVATVHGQREEGEKLACIHGYASANARLIAAAPELLAALEKLAALADDGVIQRKETGKAQWSLIDEMKKISHAALAKAKGAI